MRKGFLIGTAALLLVAAPLLADGGQKKDLDFGIYAGYGWPDEYGGTHPKDDQLYGARVGGFATEHWSYEFSFHRLSTRTDIDPVLGIPNADLDLDSLRLNLLYNFAPGKSFRPFVTGGIGRERTNSPGLVDAHDVGYNAGGGFRWFWTDAFGLRVDGRYNSVKVGVGLDERQNNVEAMVGLMWAVGKGGAEKAVSDNDGDGVPDKKDKCPNTPAGATVDQVGCPSDADGDGVYDGIDQCPDTPKGWPVDGRGCPKDSDGDTVPDGKDACPDTPRGATVDDKGCPSDADDDGVYDGIDRCPDTPRGVKVDTGGCPLDSDGDGVEDSRDRCPDTPRGVQVDADGCPPAKAAPLFEGEKKSLILEGVNFETDQAVLTPDSMTALDRVAASLQDWPEVRVEIGGHTDSTGSAAHNRDLSLRRSTAVKDYLVGKGVDGSRLTVKGYGPDKPIASNKTKEGRARNRRVELTRLD